MGFTGISSIVMTVMCSVVRHQWPPGIRGFTECGSPIASGRCDSWVKNIHIKARQSPASRQV
jgi:hypothetical protein